jgi:hypothetical protein
MNFARTQRARGGRGQYTYISTGIAVWIRLPAYSIHLKIPLVHHQPHPLYLFLEKQFPPLKIGNFQRYKIYIKALSELLV